MNRINLDDGRNAIVYRIPDAPTVFAASSLAIDESPEYYSRQTKPPLLTPAHQQWVTQMGVNPQRLALVHQVHGDTLKVVTEPGDYGNGDGLLTTTPDVYLAVRTADCAAVFLVAPRVPLVALLHVGWRGARLRFVEKTVELLRTRWHLSPEELVVVVSPALHGCCYEVTEEFLSYFDQTYFTQREGRWYFRFEQVLADALRRSGIVQHRSAVSPWCTSCAPVPLHSYRRDKTPQRMLHLIGIANNATVEGESYGID